MGDFLILWNPDDDYLEELSNSFEENELVIISSQKDYDAISNYAIFQWIIILAELNWEEMPFSAFGGFQRIQQLRKDGVLSPIFVCSFLPRKFFLGLGNIPYGILRASYAHPFLQLPADISKEIKRIETRPIYNYSLEDVIQSFFDLNGFFEETFHRLKDKVTFYPEQEIENAFHEFEKITPHIYHDELLAIQQELLTEIEQSTIDPVQSLNKYKPKIKALIPTQEALPESSDQVAGWLLLFIDDNELQKKRIEEAFKAAGIPCISTSSGQKAIEILKNDANGKLVNPSNDQYYPANSIVCVVTDLRLLQSNGDWQPLQGYELIDYIFHRLPNLVSFFILTSHKGTILKSFRKFNTIQVFWFAKEDVLNTISKKSFNFLADRVKEEGKKTYEALLSYPKAKYWKDETWQGKMDYPLNVFYRHHRMSKQYLEKENWISTCALKYIEEAELVKDQLFRNKKTIDDLGFSYQFKSGQMAPPTDAKSMNNFYTKLIGRRIAIGLFLKGWSEYDISDILKYQELKTNHYDRQLFNAYLALPKNIGNAIPTYLLIEERNWVQHKLKISLDVYQKNFFNVLKEAVETLQDKLYKAGCADDFVEAEIKIATVKQAEQVVSKAILFAEQFKLDAEFKTDIQNLLTNKHFRHAASVKKFKSLLKNQLHIL